MATIRKREGRKGVRWQAQVRKDGQTQSSTFRTKSEAQAWANAVEVEIDKGTILPTSEAKKRTVTEMLERYIEYEVPKKGDQRNPTRVLKWWIKELGDTKLSQLTPPVIVEIRDRIGKDRTGSTVNRYLAHLSHACTIAEKEWGWLEANPLRKVKRLPESTGRVRFLSDDERVKLLKKTAESPHPYLHAVVLVAITTGARKGEVLSLKWSDVDLNAGRAVLNQTKNKERRPLTLVPQVIDALRKLQKVRVMGVDEIFIDPKIGKRSVGQFEQAWRAARDDAGIKDFRFHDLRHTAASYMVMNGASPGEIAAVLGHKTLQMVKRYAHLSDEHVRGVVESAASRVFGDE